MKKVNSKIINFAKNNGYKTAEYLCKWKDYDVYEPIYSTEENCVVGLPYVILVKKDEIRMSTEDESLEINM